MSPSHVNVEDKNERSGHEDFILIQLGHRNIQGLAGIDFAVSKGDALDRSLCLDCSERFFCVCWMQRFLNRHCSIHTENYFFNWKYKSKNKISQGRKAVLKTHLLTQMIQMFLEMKIMTTMTKSLTTTKCNHFSMEAHPNPTLVNISICNQCHTKQKGCQILIMMKKFLC